MNHPERAGVCAAASSSIVRHAPDRFAISTGDLRSPNDNVWGTSFQTWYAEDARFRFVLRFDR